MRSDYRGGRPAAGKRSLDTPRPARGTAFPKVATLSAMLPLPRNVLFSPIVVFAMVMCYHLRGSGSPLPAALAAPQFEV